MVAVGILTDNHPIVTKYIEKVAERLSSENFIKNPFQGKVKRVFRESGVINIIIADALYPPLHYIGIILFAVAFIFTGFSWYTFPGAFIASTWTLRTRLPLIIAANISLRRMGYRGKIKPLTHSEVINSLI